jgi:hypothetical protein
MKKDDYFSCFFLMCQVFSLKYLYAAGNIVFTSALKPIQQQMSTLTVKSRSLSFIKTTGLHFANHFLKNPAKTKSA